MFQTGWAVRVKKERGYTGIAVGKGYTDISFPGNKEKIPYPKKEEFGKQKDIYTDIGNEIYRIAKRGRPKTFVILHPAAVTAPNPIIIPPMS